MSRRSYAYFIATRGGVPCVMEANEHANSEGVLVPTPGAEPTQFAVDREHDKYPPTYAKRRVERAIERTENFIALFRNSVVNDHPFVKRVLAAHADPEAVWNITPVCQPKQKPSS